MKKVSCLTLLGALAALLFGAGVMAACGETEPCAVHQFGEWTVSVPATCERAGEETRTCSVCDFVETRAISATGHEWDDGKIETERTCEQDGLVLYTCRNCSTEREETLKAQGHSWKTSRVIQAATCTKPGLEAAECRNCDEKDNEHVIPALGHEPDKTKWHTIQDSSCMQEGLREGYCTRCKQNFEEKLPKLEHEAKTDSTIIEREATCTAVGKESFECKYCGERIEREIPKTNHTWDSSYTIDELPTADREGSKSQHCSGCDARRNVVAIPSLSSGKSLDYEFRLVRTNGEKLSVSGVKVDVYRLSDGQEEWVQSANTDRGAANFTLPIGEYCAKVSGLPLGYSAEEKYTFETGEILCKIPLKGTLIAKGQPVADTYRVGTVVRDFTFTTIATKNSESREISLGELLQEKKIVVLNFWATWCGPCENEFPALKTAYEKYKDSIAVIAVNSAATGDTREQIVSYANDHDLPFWFVKDDSENLYGKAGTGSIPLTVIIDSEGVICYHHVGTLGETEFENAFRRYAGTTAAQTEIALLPETAIKRRRP